MTPETERLLQQELLVRRAVRLPGKILLGVAGLLALMIFVASIAGALIQILGPQ